MAGWSLDKDRFKAEVLGPMDRGWDPRTDLFRVLQLPLRDNGEAEIQRATEAACKFVRNSPRGSTSHSHVPQLIRSAASDLLLSNGRGSYVKRVQELRERALGPVREALSDGPGLPLRQVERLLAADQHLTRSIVEEWLVGRSGSRIREPVPLPSGPTFLGSMAGQVTGALPDASETPLWRFLEITAQLHPPTAVPAANAKIGAVIGNASDAVTELRKKIRNDQNSRSIEVATWLGQRSVPDVTALLRQEVVGAVAAAAAGGYPAAVARARALSARSEIIGLPGDADELAYAVWCDRRFRSEAREPWAGDYRTAVAERRLGDALALMTGWTLTPDWQREADEVRSRLAAAMDQLAAADRLCASDPDAAAAGYLAVLAVLEEPAARRGLVRCAPAPPARLTASIADARSVVLTWPVDPVPPGDISYLVVRKEFRPPEGPDDGTVIARGLSCGRAVDDAAPPGEVLHYAVYTARDDRPGDRAALALPLQLLPEVEAAVIEQSGRSGIGRWRLPAGAGGAVVRRADGTSVDAGRQGFTDRGLLPGSTGRYRVHAVYRGPDGSSQESAGVILELRIETPPASLQGFAFHRADGLLLLSWEPTDAGDVEFVLGTRPPVPGPGSAVLSPGPDLLRLIEKDLDRGRARAQDPRLGRDLWLTPVTTRGQLSHIGDPVHLRPGLEAVGGLHAEVRGRWVIVSWLWPAATGQVWVLTRSDQAPEAVDDPQATRRLVTQSGYRAEGCRCERMDGDQWIAVVPTARVAGQDRHGRLSAVQVVAPRSARAELRRSLWPRRRRTLLVTWPHADDLPGMTVRVKPEIRPYDATDGEELVRLGPGPAPGTARFDIPRTIRRPRLQAFSLDPGVVLELGPGWGNP